MQRRIDVSERLARKAAGQSSPIQRHNPTQKDDEDALTQAIVYWTSEYGQYGYSRITALLNHQLFCRQRSRGTHLAASGAEGAQEAAIQGSNLAQR